MKEGGLNEDPVIHYGPGLLVCGYIGWLCGLDFSFIDMMVKEQNLCPLTVKLLLKKY